MLRAIEHHAAGEWPGEAAASVTLDFDARHRRRIKLTADNGEDVLLDLPQAIAMADGDGLRLEDGRWLLVRASPEPLLEIRCSSDEQLLRVAWHLGNRHLPAEISASSIRIRPDHVIEAMVKGLGASVTKIDAPFQPEGGAYGGHSHGHAHSHSHSHSHGHAHDHSHSHGHDAHSHSHDH